MKRSLKRLVAVFMLFLHIEGSNKRYLTIRNNKNVITGEEGRLLAESILSRTRLYYRYYYKSGDKNGQYKNKRR
ncbi:MULTISPECIES: hypothetical protein [Fusobacterium]|uniref:Uncharacterized protein n=2 Tax=Fusobacterium animalis TaxID=76859 RepID=A0A2B7YXR4_9FUSO|nr:MULTISPECIES: hypothetical protein [Fusobacterium]ALF22778.1 hypothetical protein RO08_10825 [Fusobacterium animalis]ASG30445.1 hypothetical protein CBG60_03800 [Fusobacterium animalis]EEO43790.1 hypothetical protein FSDG_02349 [Fusobacterium animalis 7_1]EPC07689.1 hypothetical protein HMPREF9369_02501 [Fusobacterium polymorphum F0401]ERT39832.1 hypothetical protein HMPREF1538_02280 [Fusobacterium nucleatum CTI-1]